MFTITQNYPQLRADAHFQNLYASLNEIEDHINAARRYYNGTVREYNQSIAVFPKVLIANSFGFKPETFFAEEAEAQKVPKVNFTGN
jgi:LemA protein